MKMLDCLHLLCVVKSKGNWKIACCAKLIIITPHSKLQSSHRFHRAFKNFAECVCGCIECFEYAPQAITFPIQRIFVCTSYAFIPTANANDVSIQSDAYVFHFMDPILEKSVIKTEWENWNASARCGLALKTANANRNTHTIQRGKIAPILQRGKIAPIRATFFSSVSAAVPLKLVGNWWVNHTR